MLFEFIGSYWIICEQFKYLCVFNTCEALEFSYIEKYVLQNLMSWASE